MSYRGNTIQVNDRYRAVIECNGQTAWVTLMDDDMPDDHEDYGVAQVYDLAPIFWALIAKHEMSDEGDPLP